MAVGIGDGGWGSAGIGEIGTVDIAAPGGGEGIDAATAVVVSPHHTYITHSIVSTGSTAKHIGVLLVVNETNPTISV